ncbi:hypothetical protein HID58_058664 [Brassica napus]|uniref:Uncharacterized protein n=1 Tax=Brassica napus TaxID=3708 RepID=A0ABQ7ZR09_BRANA|nr:hypothetical protein HID58_058664 [Brassica napus]
MEVQKFTNQQLTVHQDLRWGRKMIRTQVGSENILKLNHCTKLNFGFPASRIIPLDPVKQRSTSPGRAVPGLDRIQYRFGVQKRQGSFRMERKSNPDGGCHHIL